MKAAPSHHALHPCFILISNHLPENFTTMLIQKTSIALALALAAAVPAQADISVASTGGTYTQSFDSLAASGNGSWLNDSTLTGWSLFNKNLAAITTYSADNGGSNAGSFRSYGATASSERALGGSASGGSYFGSPATGAVAGWIAVALNNDTGADLAGFKISFDGEQWRNGGNTTAQTMVMEYAFGATFATATGWTAPGASFNFSSPVVGAAAAAVNGNSTGLMAGLGGEITANWAAGSTLWVRWIENNDSGNDHGLAIDNVVITAVPEPTTYAMLLAGLGCVGFIARRRKAA